MAESVTLEYQTLGDDSNTAVIIIHGLFGDKDNLKSLARDLQDDFFCVMVDARNHGDSPHCQSMTYSEMAADVIATCDQLKLDKFHVVGHSMGGKIAMQVAMDYSERVISAVFADIAPAAYDGTHDDILTALTELDLGQISSRKAADQQLQESIKTAGVRQFLLKNLQKTDESYQWRLNLNALVDNYQSLSGTVTEGHYSGPVLFIKGGDSNYLRETHRDAITERFNYVEVKVIEGTGHWLHAEKPRSFNRLVRQFLEH
ncbi:alpha/beta fold hydrolase [Idiomarina seosinensis]|uniref:Alpha/beta hydrolase n=1 Tax=Idiomarina seosinensis TaxID=281739 RepID=A0A432ZI96_9GAMM|nr:alpha/beta fold hydrolase [Idiomarina seosinensis]RUO77755.1 alpha/beta hydrolase [Idiomarina seosinensis]